jgi:hypothetical protein
MLKDKLMKHLAKKGVKDLDPLEKEAKLGVASELHKQASDMLGGKIHPAKKVTVAADSSEGLKAGLDKAAGLVDSANQHETDPDKMVESAEEEMHADLDHDNEAGESPEHVAKVKGGMHNPELPMGDESPEEESAESPHQESEEDVAAEHADHSPEELDAKIAHLHTLRAKKLSGRA